MAESIPRLLEVVETAPLVDVGAAEEPAACEVERLAIVLGGIREAVDKDGSVVDLAYCQRYVTL